MFKKLNELDMIIFQSLHWKINIPSDNSFCFSIFTSKSLTFFIHIHNFFDHSYALYSCKKLIQIVSYLTCSQYISVKVLNLLKYKQMPWSPETIRSWNIHDF